MISSIKQKLKEDHNVFPFKTQRKETKRSHIIGCTEKHESEIATKIFASKETQKQPIVPQCNKSSQEGILS